MRKKKRCVSKGEIEIRNYLRENNIRFTKQKKFKTCKNIRVLRFDFYLPDFNLLIEYQGKQHFEPIKRCKSWSDKKTIEEFEKIKSNDRIKKTWCAINGKKLITINYNSKNIFKKIKKEIGL